MVTKVEIKPEITGTEAPVVEEQVSDNNRPEWLPEKFNSAEDLAKAYGELESKLGSPKAAAEETEEKKEAEEPTEDKAKEVTENAGLDYDALSAEYAENGELSDDAYAKLEEAGIPKDLVDSYIKGQEALSASKGNEIVESVGGQDAYQDMIKWAKDNFSADEISGYNDVVNGTNQAAIKFAVEGLKARYDAANKEPSFVSGKAANETPSGYRSWAEVKVDMGNPKYNTDPAFRADVAAKLANSQL